MKLQTIKFFALAIAVTACATEDMDDDPAGEMAGEELWDEGPTPELDAVQPDEEVVTDIYAASPAFQLPFPCNQTWAGQTRTNHSPQLSIDFNRTDDLGDTVAASAAGTITRVRNEGNVSYGRWVEVRHGNGFTTRYAHLSTQSVSVGQTVSRGQKLGTVGSTGGSTGPHLHYELRQNGVTVRAKFNGATALYFGTKNYKSAQGGGGGRGGASGTIGATLVANAPADGYTILMGNAPTHGLAPNLIKNLGYDPVKDFSPICRIASSAYVLAVSATLPVNSVKELIAYAKSKPGQLNYASTGNGTGVHLAGAFFNSKGGVDVKHIPYNNVAQLLGDISSGTVAMIFYPYQPLTPVVQSGKVRLLATTGAKRPSYLPQLPTMIESGMPGFAISAWHGFYAPAGTPASHVQILYEAIRIAMTDPKVAASLAASGTEVDLAPPAEFAAFTKGEVERYRQLIMLSGVKPE